MRRRRGLDARPRARLPLHSSRAGPGLPVALRVSRTYSATPETLPAPPTAPARAPSPANPSPPRRVISGRARARHAASMQLNAARAALRPRPAARAPLRAPGRVGGLPARGPVAPRAQGEDQPGSSGERGESSRRAGRARGPVGRGAGRVGSHARALRAQRDAPGADAAPHLLPSPRPRCSRPLVRGPVQGGDRAARAQRRRGHLVARGGRCVAGRVGQGRAAVTQRAGARSTVAGAGGRAPRQRRPFS
jgi:hypothetical protein